ncbi:MAG: hypothetical protein ABIQ31_21915 [Ferruginibacter sp.]
MLAPFVAVGLFSMTLRLWKSLTRMILLNPGIYRGVISSQGGSYVSQVIATSGNDARVKLQKLENCRSEDISSVIMIGKLNELNDL